MKRLIAVIAAGIAAGRHVAAAPTQVFAAQKISDTDGGFAGILDNQDWFGGRVAALGDLDGDGVGDLAVAARRDSDGGPGRGAVWVLFLNMNGTVRSHAKISSTSGNFAGPLHDHDEFGSSVASIGDLNGDGVTDLAVGAEGDEDGCGAMPNCNKGAVWILFLDPGGSVVAHQKISATQGGFPGTLNPGDQFGHSVALLGDLDSDGVEDLAVGQPFDASGGPARGAVRIVFLNSNGTVKGQQKISSLDGGFTGTLDNFDQFGRAVAPLGDLDADGVLDLAVGTPLDDDGGGPGNGAVWTLFLNANGTVRTQQKISTTQGGFPASLGSNDYFGADVALINDNNGDAVPDLAVGAPGDDDGCCVQRGAMWILLLNSNGTVQAVEKISTTQGCFAGPLNPVDNFGESLTFLGDLNSNGSGDVAVGAPGDDTGGFDRGAVWILFLIQVQPFGSYCTGKQNSQGCTPVMAAAGTPSLTNSGPFSVTASSVINNKFGILFYGLCPSGVPFQGGVRCVKSPFRRTPVQNSAGNPPPDDCSGVYAFDFNTWLQGGSDPTLVADSVVHSQYWYRDPTTASTTGLSNALAFTILP